MSGIEETDYFLDEKLEIITSTDTNESEKSGSETRKSENKKQNVLKFQFIEAKEKENKLNANTRRLAINPMALNKNNFQRNSIQILYSGSIVGYQDPKTQQIMGVHNEEKNSRHSLPNLTEYNYNRYGFLIEKDPITYTDKELCKKTQFEKYLNSKWMNIKKNWHKTQNKKPKQLKKLIRSGIPNSFRGVVWEHLIGSYRISQKYPNVYPKLISNIDPDLETEIRKDLNRTFPFHENFQNGSFQEPLFRILIAWSNCEESEDIGYVQGMPFIAGAFLIYLTEEDAFYAFKYLMTKYQVREIFRSGFPLIWIYIYQLEKLLEIHLPDLFNHLKKEGLKLQDFVLPWLIGIFAERFSFEIVVRIWDIYFNEGSCFLLKFILSLLSWKKKEILSLGHDDIYFLLQNLSKTNCNIDFLISRALNFKIKEKELQGWASEYKKKHNIKFQIFNQEKLDKNLFIQSQSIEKQLSSRSSGSLIKPGNNRDCGISSDDDEIHKNKTSRGGKEKNKTKIRKDKKRKKHKNSGKDKNDWHYYSKQKKMNFHYNKEYSKKNTKNFGIQQRIDISIIQQRKIEKLKKKKKYQKKRKKRKQKLQQKKRTSKSKKK
ncbi:rab-gtpase-tbc domain-containing protein-related [Anaeramoeba flamelloides]|uniref:Rab-gtpase-tbc domain-containing protein-related n=1 Tax=Anaeramoeba flamelloides TaxID=1746091 RepID=A0AAV7Y3L5_9EUKA|nr:rab-gtpase-tbc domain-containing protein-related [Anaeramoeba flamelloides]